MSFSNLLLELLLELKEMPTMYLGEKSLKHLRHFVCGAVLFNQKISNQYEEFLPGFELFVKIKYNTTETRDVYGVIIINTSSDEEALDRYFELLDEFLALSEDNRKDLFAKWMEERFPPCEEEQQ